MIKDIVKQAEEKMKSTVEHFRKELAGVKAGRATPALLDKVHADYYGTSTPISQLATISAPEPRVLIIDPWDKSAMKAIEKAILQSDLGLNPNNDGKVIRLNLPPLTAERRKEIVKTLHKRAEEERVVVRNIRRDAIEHLKKMQKDKQISEDDLKRGETDVQKVTDRYIKELDHVLEVKEKEVMEV